MTIAPDWGHGFSVRGGGLPTRADLDDLASAATALERAADHLDAAGAALGAARTTTVAALVGRTEPARALLAALDRARGPLAPGHLADELRDLGRRVREVVGTYVEAESTAHRLLRAYLALGSETVGRLPLGARLLAGLGLGSVATGLAARVLLVRALAAGVGDRDAAAVLDRVRRDVRGLTGALTADGHAELEVRGLAGLLAGDVPGLDVDGGRTVRQAAALLVALLPAAGPVVVLPRAEPPQLPAPRDVAGVLENVGRTYGPGGALTVPGTPDGTITVQRLTHPDGTRSWVVEVPGTESGGFGGDVPTDMTTNLRLMAGAPDDMSTAVLDAMRQAGVPPDEPVVLAGHSQGGMVAMKAASLAVGTYDVRAVITAGSPDVPVTLPAGVEVLHLRHVEDAIPQTDGRPDEPSGDVLVLTRDLAATGGPAVPTPVEAHDLRRYVETARRAQDAERGDPGLRRFDATLATVLGPPGTTAATLQYQATRDPDLVRTDPVTGLPRPPELRPVASSVGVSVGVASSVGAGSSVSPGNRE